MKNILLIVLVLAMVVGCTDTTVMESIDGGVCSCDDAIDEETCDGWNCIWVSNPQYTGYCVGPSDCSEVKDETECIMTCEQWMSNSCIGPNGANCEKTDNQHDCEYNREVCVWV